MKNYLSIILISFLIQNLYSQEIKTPEYEFPSEFGEFTFPLWSKITLELKETENGKLQYRILSLEPYEDFYSLEKRENLFSENPKENTIEIYFIGAYYNEGKEDSDYKTLLKLRNNLKFFIDYKADIKYYFKDNFENTNIIGAFPNADTQEIWNHKIDYIKLYDFQKGK